MRVLFQLRLMLLAISKERGRMVLVILMVALGVASVMVLISLGNGAQREVEATMEKSGRNLMVVARASIQYLPGRGSGWYLSQSLKERDAKDLLSAVDGIVSTASVTEQQLVVKFADSDLRTMVKGVTTEYTGLRNYQLDTGRLLNQEDFSGRKKVAVIGSFVSQKLNKGFSLLGEKILLGDSVFLVVGELREKGRSKAGTNYDDLVLVPYETARHRIFNKNYLDRIILKHSDDVDVIGLKQDISEVLSDNHNINFGENLDFEILIEGAVDKADQTSDSLLAGLAVFFTGITLLAAGVGVLAVSYLNVLDRKAEIGLRMALGSTQRGIATMIVMEAAILSAMGGLLGVMFGLSTIYIFRLFTEWLLVIDFGILVLPLIITVVLGMLFSVLPAGKAARMLPVEALRSE